MSLLDKVEKKLEALLDGDDPLPMKVLLELRRDILDRTAGGSGPSSYKNLSSAAQGAALGAVQGLAEALGFTTSPQIEDDDEQETTEEPEKADLSDKLLGKRSVSVPPGTRKAAHRTGTGPVESGEPLNEKPQDPVDHLEGDQVDP